MFHSLINFANGGVSNGAAVGLAIVCLLEYIAHLQKMHRARCEIASARSDHERVRQELDGVSTELGDLMRERAVTRFEAQVLREFVAQEDCEKAVRLFMRRLVPNPDEGFAAFLRVDHGRMIVTQSHGLVDAAAAPFDLESQMLSRLQRGESLTLSRPEIRDGRWWNSLASGDRNKVQQLHLFGIGPPEPLLGVLMTTTLAPPGIEPAQQIQLARRLLSGIAFSLRDKQQVETQQDRLRSTGEMLTLRTVVDRTYDSPAQMLEEFIRQSAEKSAADRAALFLSTADASVPLRAFVRCGPEMQPSIEDQWQRYEDELAQVSVSLRKPQQYPADELERLGIVTLMGSALVVPVLQRNRALGLVCFSRRTREPFSEGEQSLAAWSGNLLADLIPRVVNQAVVERQARLDGLTQLANRGEFDRQLQQELIVAGRSKTPLSLLMFDLDRFKSINDTYGHRGGDAVLRAAANVIRDCVRGIRTADRAVGVLPFVARYGGEELAVLIRLDKDAARRIGEFIRTRLEMQSIDFEGQAIRVTTSVGVASYPEHAGSGEDLVAAADAALYEAKANGRNRLELARPALIA